MGSSHKHNLTPHVSLTVFAIIQFLIPSAFMLISYAGGWQTDGTCIPFDAFNAAGLFGAMGFERAGEATLLLRLLERRFGPLPDSARIASPPPIPSRWRNGASASSTPELWTPSWRDRFYRWRLVIGS